MLEQLGDLLRLALDHAEDQVIPLQRELAFVDRYMKLQKVRYEDRLDVVLDVDPLALQALVPTFILQPLLENAIRHGIATRSAPGQIEIQAWCEGDALHLSVRDDGPGLAVNWDIERQAGVGLSNTRERLKRLYGDRQSFAIAGAVGVRRPGRPAVPAPARGRIARRRRARRAGQRPVLRSRRPRRGERSVQEPLRQDAPQAYRRGGGDGGGRRRSSTAAP